MQINLPVKIENHHILLSRGLYIVIPNFKPMLPIDSESIKRITNGDIIARGNPNDIEKGIYEDGWYIVRNIRESEELEVERSGSLQNLPSLVNVNRRLSYGELVDIDWYIL